MKIIIFSWILSLILLYLFLEKRKKRRIDEVLTLVDKIQRIDYRIPMKQDDFSILEDAIYKLFVQAIEAKEQSEKSAKRQIENLEDIAHQIKTPITAMLFSIENLDKENTNLEELESLKGQVIRLNTLSDILLKLSSLDINQDSMKKERINLAELLDYTMEIVSFRENIRIEVSDSLKEMEIIGDFYWISEALINILKNADQMPLCDKIRIDSNKTPHYTSLIIEDNGGGIPKEHQRKIFQRFYKKPDSKGFGIGLAMSKTIVEKNNGTISASNSQDGALFELKFYHVTE